MIRAQCQQPVSTALVLGSGLGDYADTLENATPVEYGSVPHMPVSHVSGHAGRFVLGTRYGKGVIAMQGRVHLYEGHGPHDVVFGVRLMAKLGAQTLVITNAAGAVNETFSPGDLMVIRDQLNLTGQSSLYGPNDDAMGPRFVDMTRAYDVGLVEQAVGVADDLGFSVQQGVYAGLLGPAYETPAEIRMLRTLGADAVGMSTVLEVLAARHLDVRVLGISCITNLGAGMSDALLHHDEVKETAQRVRQRFTNLIDGVLKAC